VGLKKTKEKAGEEGGREKAKRGRGREGRRRKGRADVTLRKKLIYKRHNKFKNIIKNSETKLKPIQLQNNLQTP
jgi:hypothetical protein